MCSSIRSKEQKWSPQVEYPPSLPGKPSKTAQVYLAKGSETYGIILRTQLFSILVNPLVSSYYEQHFLEFQLCQESEGKGSSSSFWHLCSAAPHWYTLIVCFWLRETCLCTGTWQQPDMGALNFRSLKVNSQQAPQWLKESCFSGHKNILLSSGTLAISFSFKIYTVSQDPRSGRCYTTL